MDKMYFYFSKVTARVQDYQILETDFKNLP